MSYSFTLRAITAAALLAAAARSLSQVVKEQPVHARDEATAWGAIKAQVELVTPPTTDQHVVVNVSGSLGWQGVDGGEDQRITSSNTSVSVSLVPADSAYPDVPVST